MNKQLLNADFKNIYVEKDDFQTSFSYRTGMTVYEEVFINGRLMAAGWNTSGYTLNVLESFPTRIAGQARDMFGAAKGSGRGEFINGNSFDIEADGISLDRTWEMIGFEQTEEKIENTNADVVHGRLTLRSKSRDIEAVVHTMLDGTPIISRWIEVKNNSSQRINISSVIPMCGGIEKIKSWKEYMKGAPDSSKIYSIGYMDGSQWGHEGYFKWHDLPNINYGITGKYIGDQRFRHPFFALRNNLMGTMMIAQLGWTGGYDFNFQLDTDISRSDVITSTSMLSFDVRVTAPNPMLILEPGEEFVFPTMHVGMLHGDFDDAINSMHKHTRKTVFTMPAPFGKKGWIECGMGAERLMDVKASKHFIDTGAAVGTEAFIVDAGWYCPLNTEQTEWGKRAGDWYPDPERYPNGIAEIRDYAHSKGMKFGLWVEIEAAGALAEKFRAEHSDWIVTDEYDTVGRLLDFANPEVVEWAEKELSRVIEEYGMELFRIDYNFALESRVYANEKNGVYENSFLRYYNNAVAMFNRLKRKYPDVIFENCAGGGSRTDLNFVSNFTHSWVSDWQVAPRSFAITNGMTMVLPPEMVDRLVSGMNCHTRGSLDFQVRNTIFGRPSTNDYNCIGSEMNDDQLAFVKHTFDIYREHIRPYIDESLIFHHTPELVSGHNGAGGVVEYPQGVGIIERGTENGKHGVIGVFKLADSMDENLVIVRPKGIDMSLNYKVTYDNLGTSFVVSGMELYRDGLVVQMEGAITSELIIYEEA